jgi:hypothetical protein
MTRLKRTALSVLLGLCLTAFCYWLAFTTGDRTLTTPTFLQEFGVIVAIPGTAAAMFVPPTGVHSDVFPQVSFVANVIFYSLLTYALAGYFGKTPNEPTTSQKEQ